MDKTRQSYRRDVKESLTSRDRAVNMENDNFIGEKKGHDNKKQNFKKREKERQRTGTTRSLRHRFLIISVRLFSRPVRRYMESILLNKGVERETGMLGGSTKNRSLVRHISVGRDRQHL